MNCQNFETVVNELARNQMMEASLREQAALHSAECDVCAARLRAERRLTSSLKELSAEFRTAHSEGAPARLEQLLMAEFRNHRSAVKVARQGFRSAYWISAAIAALFLVMIGIGATRLFVSAPPENKAENKTIESLAPTRGVNSESVQSATPEATVAELPRKQPNRARRGTVVAHRKGITPVARETLSASNRDNEVTTDFYPVGYSSALSVQDGGQVVRVEMPRSAMARFGVPVNMDRYDERVKADVLVGTDGLARAIRFVQSRD